MCQGVEHEQRGDQPEAVGGHDGYNERVEDFVLEQIANLEAMSGCRS